MSGGPAGGASVQPRIPGLVSVVIPAYNAGRSVARAIRSALAQTYSPVEVIVVNDGSTDDTESVVLQFGGRVRYFRQENRGETAARNRGFSAAHGEFVTFVDHDDYWEPGFVEACVAFLRETPEAVAVSAGHEHRNALKQGASIRPEFLADEAADRGGARIVERFFEFWHAHDHICAGSAVLRGSLIDEAGGQREDLALSGDMEYWAYLATFGPWGFIPRVLLHVDGTQVPRGMLYRKYHDRYRRCPTVESWQSRVLPRLGADDLPGFEKIRGRVAGGFVLANVFVGRDAGARAIALAHRGLLEGPFGTLWRLGLRCGPPGWALLCRIVRLRNRLRYSLAELRRNVRTPTR